MKIDDQKNDRSDLLLQLATSILTQKSVSSQVRTCALWLDARGIDNAAEPKVVTALAGEVPLEFYAWTGGDVHALFGDALVLATSPGVAPKLTLGGGLKVDASLREKLGLEG